MIEAGKFAKPQITAGDGYFRFGIADRGEVAQVLRRMADDIETGKILIEHVQTGQIAASDDYFRQCLLIEFAEKEPMVKSQLPAVPARVDSTAYACSAGSLVVKLSK